MGKHLEKSVTFSWLVLLILLQITESLAPASLQIFNDSHLHAHHKAMEGSTSRETHFRYILYRNPSNSEDMLKVIAESSSHQTPSKRRCSLRAIAWFTVCSRTRWRRKVAFTHYNYALGPLRRRKGQRLRKLREMREVIGFVCTAYPPV